MPFFLLATWLRNSSIGSSYFGRSRTGIVVLLLCAFSAQAEPINWRSDYNSARREAMEKGLPLLLDVGTENCFWCKKLDATTFQDSAIVALLKTHFIPLKVDANQNSPLAEALRIQSFPTLILAGPDGKILGTFEGYLESARLKDLLQRTLAGLNNPEWMARDFKDAELALNAGDYARAVALLKSILIEDKNLPIQAKARQLLNDLEQQASGKLARAKQLEDKGQTPQALDTLTDLLRSYTGTQAALDGGQMLTALTAKPEITTQQRSRRAGELLAQAKDDFRSQQFLGCLERCEILTTTFADLPEGLEAGQLLSEIKNNPEWMRQACQNLSGRLGMLYLAMAETWLKKGQPQQAIFYLERVIQAFPGTREADSAQTRLSQLHGQPTRPANFRKP
ncbi:MAG TPA: DUF255 domain-containing protein [Gemmataceae bacterium]|nr:DUF255 domain-containing protein [Gemmataceae bacterium]